MSKKITLAAGTARFDHGITKENGELFKERVDYVLNAYSELLSGQKENVYSHVTGSNCPKSLGYCENLHILFVKTNEVYHSTIEENRKKLFHESLPNVHESVTHVVFTDMFGRVLKVEETSKDLPSLYSLFYGIDTDSSHIDHFWFNNDHRLLMPIGNLISGRNLFSIDSLGFRLSKTKRTIWDLDHDSNEKSYHDIGIVGGSFVHGLFSLPGESFSEILEDLLNSSDYSKTKKFRVWNLSMPGHVQSDSFTLLTSASLIKRFDTILWIDGVNDLFTTTNFASIGLPNIPLPLTLKWNGIKFRQRTLRGSISDGDRINLFIEYRKYICKILDSLDIKCINILQPTINLKNPHHGEDTSALFPFYSKLAWGHHQKAYSKSIPYIQQLGKLDNLEFYSYEEDTTNPLDFWDFVHLSPRGESQYAEYLKNIVIGNLK